ncbi:hypothetical protein, partial [Salana multivorans]|uniref:hypothetical protein n=1 Tax=Salana multivorans TaxID=120377 RepID=UPI001B8730EC
MQVAPQDFVLVVDLRDIHVREGHRRARSVILVRTLGRQLPLGLRCTELGVVQPAGQLLDVIQEREH